MARDYPSESPKGRFGVRGQMGRYGGVEGSIPVARREGVILGRPMRDHLRALLVTCHILVVMVLAFPQPGLFMHKRAWAKPEAQDAFGALSRGMGRLGVAVTPAEIESILWTAGSAWQQARRKTVQHVQFYVNHCGVKQRWSMFASVPAKSGRLEIELEQGGAWSTIYVAQDPERDWRGSVLRQERLRAYISDFAWHRRGATFPRFVDALALRAGSDFPDATRLRARMRTLHFPPPATLRETGSRTVGAPYFETTVDLGAYR
ncbi:MAG: hypothetical protein VX000_05230 [Myxococcota bacterium]|nr:hypothetical protein [Myxococcota bacterium]